MAAELVAGGMAHAEVMGLPPGVLVAVYEARTRMDARRDASFVHSIAAAIGGSLSEKGHEVMRSHVQTLLAYADGKPLPEAGQGGGNSYTVENAPYL